MFSHYLIDSMSIKLLYPSRVQKLLICWQIQYGIINSGFLYQPEQFPTPAPNRSIALGESKELLEEILVFVRLPTGKLLLVMKN